MNKKLLAILIPSILLTACAHQKNIKTTKVTQEVTFASIYPNYQKVTPDIYSSLKQNQEVIKDGRYTLVTSSPEGGQKYLLDQFVSMKLKNKRLPYSVKNGIDSILTNTGYTLCSSSKDHSLPYLLSRKLPKVHYQIKNMHLKDALQMLAGPSFELIVDESKRQVCFNNRNRQYTLTTTTKTTQLVNSKNTSKTTKTTANKKDK